MSNIDVIKCEKLSSKNEARYIVVDKSTGEVLDDAQGYGYKTKQKAYAAHAYKTRDPAKSEAIAQKKAVIKDWCKKNKAFVHNLDDVAFEIAKGSWGPDDKFDAKLVGEIFKEAGFTELPFTIAEFLKHYFSR